MTEFYKVNLTPGSPTNFPLSRTICLVDGDFPYIIFEDGSGERYPLHLGQSLPAGELNLRLINPFDRRGQAILARDVPINLEGIRNPFEELRPQTGQVEYHASFSAALGDGSAKVGAGILSTKSRLYVEATFADGTKIETFEGASIDFLDAKPAGFMEDDEVKLVHASGDVMGTVKTISGGYNAADVNTWIASANYSGKISTIAKGAESWRGIIEPGTALFLSQLDDKEWKTNIRFLDMGSYYADEASA